MACYQREDVYTHDNIVPVDRDTPFARIVSGRICHFPREISPKAGQRIYVLRADITMARVPNYDRLCLSMDITEDGSNFDL
jgi:hypothetical protein